MTPTAHPIPIADETPKLLPFDSVSQDDWDRQHALGQFFTPSPVAGFMASLFEIHSDEVRLLDAGAGAGALSIALIERLCRQPQKPKRIVLTAYEIDVTQIKPLQARLENCRHKCERAGVSFSAKIFNEDFIAAAVSQVRGDLFALNLPCYNAAIINPPYRKIRSDSHTRTLLRSAGIEASNLYAGFVALVTRLLEQDGEMVAITPRSFCNGPYFKAFRKDFLEKMSLRRLHVFESRSAAFRGDEVLQENIIFRAIKGMPAPGQIILSNSSGEPGSAVAERAIDFQEVVSSADADCFIHLPMDHHDHQARHAMGKFSTALAKLGLTVSTGRVVDFRAKEFLREQTGADTVPLIYPCHFNGGFIHWPKEKTRKPNAIVSNEQTKELLVPAGVYVLVKRFTSKEERKRIVACIYDSQQIPAQLVGFENHLNYFHFNGQGLSMALAKGLAAFLNSTVVDVYFRQFNGHTQVNATDLRSLRYPTKAELEKLGQKITDWNLSQAELDTVVTNELF